MSTAKVQAGGIIRKSRDLTWGTPRSILDRVDFYFEGQIPFDPATALHNPTRALRFCAGPAGTMFAREDLASKNGLEVSWDWPVWVNPPFCREWIEKIGREAERGQEVVALLPCNRFETEYMQRVLASAQIVCWHRGRVAFVSSIDGAEVSGNPYASMILGFNVARMSFHEAFSPLGLCLQVGARSVAC